MELSNVFRSRENLRNHLKGNPYPGRGMVLGMDETGKNMIQVYWAMGRSVDSRNRVFSVDNGRVFTELADPSKTKDKDTSLILYNAMHETSRDFVVSNGEQTDKVISGIYRGNTFQGSLRDCKYEPDAPNFTPRITGICSLLEYPFFGLDIIRKSIFGDDSCERFFYRYDKIENGFGFCVTTYMGDGNPLPSFTGEPLLMPLIGGIEALADWYWQMLNPENRVALAVKFISISHGKSTVKVINKYTKV